MRLRLAKLRLFRGRGNVPCLRERAMTNAIRMSAVLFGLAASHVAEAQSTGTIRFHGSVVTPTVSRESALSDTQSGDAPHRTSERSLAVAKPSGIELLDYFVASRREMGIDAERLRLVTATYP